MEIIHISTKKIKISLTKNDLEKYSLDTDNIDYSNTGTRKAFWSILDDAKRSSGFDAAKSRILIQIFTSPAGGCEMFVTSMNSDEDESVRCIKDPVTETSERTYSFSSLDDLICACKCLSELGCISGSSAYYCGERYYLSLNCPDTYGEHYPIGVSYGDLLCEFGEALGSSEKALIDEHAVCFCKEDAIRNLAAI